MKSRHLTAIAVGCRDLLLVTQNADIHTLVHTG